MSRVFFCLFISEHTQVTPDLPMLQDDDTIICTIIYGLVNIDKFGRFLFPF